MIRMNYLTAIGLLSLLVIVGCDDKTTTEPLPKQTEPETVQLEIAEPSVSFSEPQTPAIISSSTSAVTEQVASKEVVLSLPSATFTTSISFENIAIPSGANVAPSATITPATPAEFKTKQTIVHIPANAPQQVRYTFSTADQQHSIEVIRTGTVKDQHFYVPGYALSYDVPATNEASEAVTTNSVEIIITE